jgi:cysteine synthase B
MKINNMTDLIGNTPLVSITRMAKLANGAEVWAKMEGQNPAGSVKDRPAYNMILQAQIRGDIKRGDTLIEATSGNTGIALAMVAAMMGYKMVLIMPANMSIERRASMAAYGAKLILVSQEQGMEGARDLALAMAEQGEGHLLNQFANPDNYLAHFNTTGPEIWRDTDGQLTHFVSAMGTTGTIVGTSLYLKSKNPAIQIVGVQPTEGASIPGIRRWPAAYLPAIYKPEQVDQILDMSQELAEETTRQLAVKEGIFAGISSGGCVAAAVHVAAKTPNAKVVCIICDRGDRYLSTNVFPAN